MRDIYSPIIVTLVDYMGSDLSVVDAARVSFNKTSKFIDVVDSYETNDDNWSEEYVDYLTSQRDDTTETAYDVLSFADFKLIQYLAAHNHWSPFAHTFIKFRVKAPIFIARQMVKHQVGLAWNEVSRRYVDSEPEFYKPEWRMRPDKSIKQGSGDTAEDTIAFVADVGLNEVCVKALDTYNNLLELGIAPEQARMVLPQNMMTEWIWSGSLQAFARICTLRLDPHAQGEAQITAKPFKDALETLFPASTIALLKDLN